MGGQSAEPRIPRHLTREPVVPEHRTRLPYRQGMEMQQDMELLVPDRKTRPELHCSSPIARPRPCTEDAEPAVPDHHTRLPVNWCQHAGYPPLEAKNSLPS